ncbi:MAG: hypothetical protein JXA95_12905 [Spirochaetales bacterium]|nr:hypothetical protein [Spirochaetales bacterium]
MKSRKEILEILTEYLGSVSASRLWDSPPEGAVYYLKNEPGDEEKLWFYWAAGWDRGLITQFAVSGNRLVVVDGVSGEILFDGVSGE